MPISESLMDDNDSSRETLRESLDDVALTMRNANSLARALPMETTFFEARVASLTGASYSPVFAEDLPRLSRRLEGVCGDRARAIRECEVIQDRMSEVAKSLKIIKNIEDDIFEKADLYY